MSLRDADGWTEATDAKVEAEDNAMTPYEDALVTVEVARRLLLERQQTARRAASLLARAQLAATTAKGALDEAVQVCTEALRQAASLAARQAASLAARQAASHAADVSDVSAP